MLAYRASSLSVQAPGTQYNSGLAALEHFTCNLNSFNLRTIGSKMVNKWIC